MNHLYFSTGRKPSALIRKLGRLLSLIFNSKYENRGKKSVDEVCARAELAGCVKIAFIYEKKGNPSNIKFFDETNGWLKTELLIHGMNLPERTGRIPKTLNLEIKGAVGKKIADLFDVNLDENDDASPLRG